VQEQGQFLMRLGLGDRVQAIIDRATTSEDQAMASFSAMKMLVAPEHMGTKFKVLCISPSIDLAVGFEHIAQTADASVGSIPAPLAVVGEMLEFPPPSTASESSEGDLSPPSNQK
jgi:hypothetical protein